MRSQSFALAPHPGEGPATAELVAAELHLDEPSLELGRGILGLRRAVAPVVPDDDRARAVVVRGDHALEVGVLERMVLHVDGQTLDLRAAVTAPWGRPSS